MKTWRKASLAVLSSMAVFATAAGLSVFAGTPDTIADLVMPVQNFDALTAGAVNPVPEPNKGGVLGPAWWATAYSGAEIVAREEGDNWLKITGNAANPYGSPIRLEKNVYTDENPYSNGNICDADMDTFLFYIKGDATQALTLLPVFYEHNPGSIGYVGGRFAATGAASYTLITAEGEVTNVTSENNMTTIPAGFEGWVVYPLSNATYRYDDGTSTEDGNTKEKLDPNRLLAVELQANAASTGAVWYLDDFCMTKQADDIVEALKKEEVKTDTAPDLDMYFGQGFGQANVGDSVDELEAVGAIRGEKDIANITYTVTDNTLSYGNALTMAFNGKEGDFLTTSFTEIGVNFSDADRAEMADADSLVMRVKTPSGTKYESFDMMIMLEESATTGGGDRDRGGVGGVFMNRESFGVDPCDVILVDAKTNQYYTNTIESPYFLPADFDGWVILPLSYFKLHPGYAANDASGQLEIGELVRIKFQVENAPLGKDFVLDNIGAAKSADFLSSLKATEMAKDVEIVMTPDEMTKVSAEQVAYVKDNGVALKIAVEDGYKLYGWTMNGADIAEAVEFDPALITEFDEIETIRSKYQDLEGYFFKTNAVPGKASLQIYLGDDYMTPYLYRYADGKAAKIEQLAVDEGGYVTFDMSEAGTWFLTEKEIAASGNEPTPSSNPDGSEPDDNPNPDNPLTGVALPLAAMAAAALSGAAVLVIRKKEHD